MSETEAIEQLWYTWSTTGLDKLNAGFRVRAASPGLMDVNSPRMQFLDRYLRYVLPSGTNFLELETKRPPTPICLAFVRGKDDEHLLTYKVYVGKDGRNRPGNYFAHLLAGLPETFTAREAIALWRYSAFWQTADVAATQQNTRLERANYDKILTVPTPPLWSDVDKHKIERLLPFVIRAYLLWRDASVDKKPLREGLEELIKNLELQILDLPRSRRKQELPNLESELAKNQRILEALPPRFERIYLAAPADEAAYLIWCLCQVLPRQWLANLTFSTYEQNITVKHECLIVNTCLSPTPSEHTSKPEELLPAECYGRLALALNCYTEDKSELLNTPLDQSQAVHYAAYATNKLLGTQKIDRLNAFLLQMSKYSNLTVEDFLDRYERKIVMDTYTPENIMRDLQDAEEAVDTLEDPSICDIIGEKIMYDPQWFQTELKPLIARLQVQCRGNPRLDQAFGIFSTHIRKRVIDYAEQHNQALFDTHLTLLQSLVLCKSDPEFWVDMLERLTSSKKAGNFIYAYWNVRVRLLLDIAVPVLSLEHVRHCASADILLSCPPSEFCHLLKLGLPTPWNCRAALLFDKSTTDLLDSGTVQDLNQSQQSVANLFLQLLQDQNNLEYKSIALHLFKKLAHNHYQAPDQLHEIWWQRGAADRELTQLLTIAPPGLETCKKLLTQYGPNYIQSETFSASLSLFTHIIQKEPDSKMFFLFALLDRQAASQNALEQLLGCSYLHAPEYSNFLTQYGPLNNRKYPQYASLYPESRAWIQALTIFVKNGQNQSKYALLGACCDALKINYGPQKNPIITQLLQAAQLSMSEAASFFISYGTYFVPFSYHDPLMRALYKSAIPHIDTHNKLFLLHSWFGGPERSLQEDLEWLLENSMLTREENTNLLDLYGVTYFSLYSTSEILLTYSEKYLDEFNLQSYVLQRNLFRLNTRTFLAFLSETASELQSYAQHISNIAAMILPEKTFLLQEDLLTLSNCLYHRQDKRDQLFPLVTQILSIHTDAVLIGNVAATFCSIFDIVYTHDVLLGMAHYLHYPISMPTDNRALGRRIAAFLPLTWHDTDARFQEKLLNELLPPQLTTEVLATINEVARNWPDLLREYWEAICSQRYPIPEMPTTFLTAREQMQASAEPVATANAELLSPAAEAPVRASLRSALLRLPRRTWKLLRLVFITIPHLLFIVMWQIPRAYKSRGTGRLTAIWLQHHTILSNNSHLLRIPKEQWESLDFAVKFHEYCRIADASRTEEAEQQIIQLVEHKPELPDFVEHENVRIKLAHTRVPIPPQGTIAPLSHPTEHSPVPQQTSW